MPLFKGKLNPLKILEMQSRGDIKGLVEALDSKSPGVPQAALDALIAIGKPAVEALIPVLDGESDTRCVNAALALGSIGDRRAVKPLIDANNSMKYNYPYRRSFLEKALRMLPDPASIELYCSAISSADNIRLLVELLEQTGEAGVEALLRRLGSVNPSERISAAFALQYLNDKGNRARSIQPLMAALKDERASVREYAADALFNISDEENTLEVKAALGAAFSVEEDLNTRLKIGALLHQYNEDYRSDVYDS
jgi:HEAT repeat protein